MTPSVNPSLHGVDSDTVADFDPFAGNELERVVPTTESQQEIWLADRLGREASLSYNQAIAIELTGDLTVAALSSALTQLVARHESLRATLSDDGTELLIARSVEVVLPVVDLRTLAAAERQSTVDRELNQAVEEPFDLAAGPLFRARLLQLAEQEHLLVFCAHHIVCDGWSLGLITSELASLYAGACGSGATDLPPADRFSDYAAFEASRLDGPEAAAAEQYWLSRFAGPLPSLNLPEDFKRPASRTFTSLREDHLLEAPLVKELKRYSGNAGISLFSLLTTGFAALLARLTGQDEVVVGIPSAGQTLAGMPRLVGHCVNLLPLRIPVDASEATSGLLRSVADLLLDALEHQRYTFGTLLKKLHIPRDPARIPLVAVMFNLGRPLAIDHFGSPGLKAEVLTVPRHFEAFELFVNIAPCSDGLRLECQFNSDLYDASTVRGWLRGYETLLRGLEATTVAPVATLPVLDPAEYRRMLAWNATGRNHDRATQVHDLIEAQVRRVPDRVALVCDGAEMTYGELGTRSNRLAQALRARGHGRGALVGLCVERGLDMVVSQVAVLKAGAAYVPLDPAYPVDRLSYMARDANLALVVTQEKLRPLIDWPAESTLLLDADAPWIGQLPDRSPPQDDTHGEDPAYVIYTSGSTGKPKGVVVPHRSVVNFLRSMATEPGLQETDRLVAVTTLSFDIAVLELLLPLSVGAQVVLAPREVAGDGRALGRLLQSSGATVMQATPSTWQLLIEAGWQGCASLKALVGGEALRPDLANSLLTRVHELWNMYGPTETTVWSTCCRVQPDPRRAISIGRPIANTSVWILDDNRQLCPIGTPGEIHIGGEGVTSGYLNRPDLTSERFVQDDWSADRTRGLYRTGDRGRWCFDGLLEHLGRLDFQVKVRGYRIELGEVESVLASHDDVRACVVIAREDTPGDTRIVAYVVPRGSALPTVEALRAHLHRTLPDYMVPQHFVQIDAVPLQPNGKVDRSSLPAPGDAPVAPDRPFVEAETPEEVLLSDIWRDLLGVDRISVTDNFFELGGHSLIAMRVVSRVRAATGIDLPLRSLFEGPTVRQLARHVHQPLPGETDPHRLADAQAAQDASLSHAQEGLWFIDRLMGPSALYNIEYSRRLTGPLNIAALDRAIQAIVQRHDTLRTAIVERDGLPVQVVMPVLAVPLPVMAVPGEKGYAQDEALKDMLESEARTPFDLSVAPLFRVRLLRLGEDEHVLQIVLHHIIADGWSLGVIERELTLQYAACATGADSPLDPLPMQFADYVQWQRRRLQGEQLAGLLAYWRKRLADAEQLALPTDRPRPPELSYRGKVHRFSIPGGLLNGVKALARQEDATLFMVLLAVFKVLLNRYSGQDDIVVGSPVAGRDHPQAENLIGFFVNTLALRCELSGDPPFREAVRRVRECALNAYAHQDLPFDQLVAEFSPKRDLSRNPIYQVSFALNNQPENRLSLQGVEVAPMAVEKGNAHFDLSMTLAERGGQLEGELEYSTDLFDRATMEQMTAHFQALLQAVVADPHRRLSALPLLSAAERHRLLVDWNDTAAPYPHDICLPQLIEAQVRRTPDKVAAKFGTEQVTYGELNRRANQLAHHLRSRGVRADSIVGVCMPRGIGMVVAMLAIMKAGGAYLPMDPEWPGERLSFMVRDAGADIVLTDSPTREAIIRADAAAQAALPFLCLDRDAGLISSGPAADPEPVASPTNLAYVIYTSGSTGLPKGVMIEHRGLVNNITWQIREFGFNADDRYLQRTTIVFDASVWELWTPLCVGALQVIADEMEMRDPLETLRTIRREAITVLQSVPSVLSMLLDEAEPEGIPESLRLYVVGGEALATVDAVRWRAASRAELVNTYGPTECTIDSTFFRCKSDGHRDIVAIGRPIANTRIYILDPHRQPVPVGVAGEIHVAGDGMARGYLNRPELTAERFVEDPFSNQPSARLYRTGDIGRYLPDGNVEFLGRRDHQVKLRGYRIELDEIAFALRASPGVEHAAVILEETPGAPARLLGYVVPEDIDTDRLRDSLKSRLPSYMIPSVLTALGALPTLSNGKLDRAALPRPESIQPRPPADEPPQGPVESALAAIWSKVLGISRVGRQDNFFELGGHSLLVVKMVQAARREGFATSVRAVFSRPTLAALAASMESVDLPDVAAPAPSAPSTPIPEGCVSITPAMLPLVSLEQSDIDRIVATVPGGAGNVKDIYPLAPLQAGILYHHQIEAEGDTYLLRNILGFDSRARLDAFLRAVQTVIDRHDSLRTAVLWENLPQPVQVVYRSAALPVVTVACPPAGDPVQELTELTDPARLRLDLAQAPLMRAYVAQDAHSETCYLSLVDHHIVGDHVSLDLMMDEVRLLLQGEEKALKDPVPYRAFVAQARSVDWSQHEGYFRNLLGDIGEGTVPFDVAGEGVGGLRSREARRPVPPELAARIYETAQRHGVSAAVLFHVAWAMVLARCSGQTDVVFGTVLLGRSQAIPDVDRVFGLCMNTLPVRLTLGSSRVKDVVVGTLLQLGELMGHDQAPLSMAQRCSSLPAQAPLFTALLNYRHSDVEPTIGDGAGHPGKLPGVWNLLSEERTNYPFNAFVDDFGNGLRLTAQVVGPAEPTRILDYLTRAAAVLVDALDDRPLAPIGSLDLLPADERGLLLQAWNRTAAAYPADRCIHQLVETQAAGRPQAVAVVSQQEAVGYGELDRRANRLARLLRARGAGRGRLVGLCVDRGIGMLVAQLAVLKAGAAYVPLDPAYPQERLRFMAADAGLAVLVTESNLDDVLAWPADRTVLLDSDADLIRSQPETALPMTEESARPDDLAYVIYTSGSTGKPKGVMVPHRAVVNFLCSMAREPGLRENDRLLAVTTLSFDIAVLELLLPLSVGAQVVLASREEATDGDALLALLERSGATVMQATPATWRMLLEAGWQGSASFTALVGGEALTPDLAAELISRSGALWNMYGPTETTVWSTCCRVKSLEGGISIGRPIANTRILILDRAGALCPVGVPGEIHIGGDGVTLGYLNRPELTAERFVADTVSASDGAGRLYRTGDRGRWREDGSLEHLGRLDFQLKVRGYRIEPGEIESILASHPDVGRCVVLAREDRPGDVRLVAYVVARTEMPAAAELRDYLRSSLPDYMVPQHILAVPLIPLLPNGKLDRAALPRPDAVGADAGEEGSDAGLATPSEHLIAGVWSELLGVEPITADDNFFSLGGHSLLAMQAIGRIEKLSGKRLGQRRIVLETLGQLAASLDSAEPEPPPRSGILRRLLGRLGRA